MKIYDVIVMVHFRVNNTKGIIYFIIIINSHLFNRSKFDAKKEKVQTSRFIIINDTVQWVKQRT